MRRLLLLIPPFRMLAAMAEQAEDVDAYIAEQAAAAYKVPS